MLAGLALRRALPWPEQGWVMLEKLNYFLLFPCLLFLSIVKAPGSIKTAAPMMLAAGVSATGAIAIAMACRWIPRVGAQRFSSGVQTAFRFNSYLGLAMAERLGGAEALALFSILISVSIPCLNVAAVYPMAQHGRQNLWRELASNPLIIATLGGLAWRLLDLPLPGLLQTSLGRLGQAALPLGLLCVGAALRWPRSDQGLSSGDRWLALCFTSIKLFLMPAIAFVSCDLLGLSGIAGLLVVMFTALPTSPASYVLAARMGGDGVYVAQLITLSLVVSTLTLPWWIQLAR
jgi:predicted permease